MPLPPQELQISRPRRFSDSEHKTCCVFVPRNASNPAMKRIDFWPNGPAILWGRKLLYVVRQTTRAATSVKAGLLHEHAACCAVVPRASWIDLEAWCSRHDTDDRVPCCARSLAQVSLNSLYAMCIVGPPFPSAVLTRWCRSALRPAASAAMLYSSYRPELPF